MFILYIYSHWLSSVTSLSMGLYKVFVHSVYFLDSDFWRPHKRKAKKEIELSISMLLIVVLWSSESKQNSTKPKFCLVRIKLAQNISIYDHLGERLSIKKLLLTSSSNWCRDVVMSFFCFLFYPFLLNHTSILFFLFAQSGITPIVWRN